MTDNSEALLADALTRRFTKVLVRGGDEAKVAVKLVTETLQELRALTRPSSAASDDAVELKPAAWSYEYRDDYKGVETPWHTRLSLTPVRSDAANARYVRNVVPLYAIPVSYGGADLRSALERIAALADRRHPSDGPLTHMDAEAATVIARAALAQSTASSDDGLAKLVELRAERDRLDGERKRLAHADNRDAAERAERDFYLAENTYAISVRHWFDAYAAALERLPAQPRGDGDAVREVLGFTAATLEQHARYNLEGVLHDIKRDTAFMTRDGGVCAGTIERVIEQLAKVEIALSPVSVEGDQGVGSQGGDA